MEVGCPSAANPPACRSYPRSESKPGVPMYNTVGVAVPDISMMVSRTHGLSAACPPPIATILRCFGAASAHSSAASSGSSAPMPPPVPSPPRRLSTSSTTRTAYATAWHCHDQARSLPPPAREPLRSMKPRSPPSSSSYTELLIAR
eukprot:COSAG04_NODE_264_length_18606_cov_9.965256_6_plen_146_part_00